MRKSRSLIVLGIILILLVGGYAYLTVKPKDQDKDATEPSSEKVTLTNLKKDDIEKMSLESDNRTLSFIKNGDNWVVEGHEDLPLNQTNVTDLAYSFSGLVAEKVVEENPTDLEKYGLKDPVVVATALFKDQTKKVFYLGNKTPAKNTYYLMQQDDPKVYTVWMNHGNHFSYVLDDVRDNTLPEINTKELMYFYLNKDGERPIEIKANEEDTQQKSYGLGIWDMTQPFDKVRSIDTEEFGKVLEAMPKFEIDRFVENDTKDLSQYGLDKPSIELQLKDKENTLHLFFGNEFEDKYVYFKTNDSNNVYGIEKSKLEPFDIKPFNLVDKFAYIVNIDLVDQVEIEGQGSHHLINLSRTTKKAEKEGDEDEVITTYKVDGKEVEEESFKQYYQSLIGILVDAEIDKQPEEKPEVTTTFTLNTGEAVVINYVPYNKDFYAVFRDGVCEFVSSRDQMDKMFQDLDLLIKGELKKD